MRNLFYWLLTATLALTIASCQKEEDLPNPTVDLTEIDWEHINSLSIQEKLDTLRKIFPNNPILKEGGREKFTSRNQTAMEFLSWYLQNINSATIVDVNVSDCYHNLTSLKIRPWIIKYYPGSGVGLFIEGCGQFVMTVKKSYQGWETYSYTIYNANHSGWQSYFTYATNNLNGNNLDVAAHNRMITHWGETIENWYEHITPQNIPNVFDEEIQRFDSDFNNPEKEHFVSIADPNRIACVLLEES